MVFRRAQSPAYRPTSTDLAASARLPREIAPPGQAPFRLPFSGCPCLTGGRSFDPPSQFHTECESTLLAPERDMPAQTLLTDRLLRYASALLLILSVSAITTRAQTFSPPLQLTNGGALPLNPDGFPQIAVDPNGNIDVVWFDASRKSLAYALNGQWGQLLNANPNPGHTSDTPRNRFRPVGRAILNGVNSLARRDHGAILLSPFNEWWWHFFGNLPRKWRRL